tara:strand:- start:655 stop:1542 length:888 start_codon:yes stop_codon:yes gene_type:complete
MLHFTIIIWGFTGIIGKILDISGLNTYEIVFWRMLIGWVTLFIYLVIVKRPLLVSKRTSLKLFGNGILIALHWYCFFQAIALSNVSVALVFMSTTALFTSFAEPIITGKKFEIKELFTGVLVIIGIVVIINDLDYSTNPNYLISIGLALTSALLAAFFSVINSVLVKENDSAIISLYELFGGFLLISIIFISTDKLILTNLSLNFEQVIWLLILGIICTSFAFLIGVYVMKFIPAYSVNLSVNLEPIYAIILAVLIFKKSEVMSFNFYIGASIVVGSILLNAYFKKQKKPHKVAS